MRKRTIFVLIIILLSFSGFFHLSAQEGKSIEEYRAEVNKKPNDAAALNNLGAALIQERNYQEALQWLEKAVQFKPTNAMVQYNLGLAYHYSAKYIEAANAYKKAIQYGMNTHKVCYNLGIVQEHLNNLTEAQQSYNDAIKKKSDSPNTYYNLAEIFIKLRDTTNAIDHYDKYLKYAPNADDREAVIKKIQSLVPASIIADKPTPVPQIPKDSTPPAIAILKPSEITKSGDEVSIEENEIIISGIVTDNQALKKIIINNKNIPISQKNPKEQSFEERARLKIGKNEIKITALDSEGNDAVFFFIADGIEPDKEPPRIMILEPLHLDTREKGIKVMPSERSDTVQTDSLRISGLVYDRSSLAGVTVSNKEVQLNPASDEEKQKFVYSDNVQKFQILVPLDLGNNEIIIAAKDVKENAARDTVKIIRKQKESRYYRKSWAILVGVNNYKNEPWRAWNLNYADDDAIELAKILREKFGFEKENMTLILDEKSLKDFKDNDLAGSIKQATLTNIEFALENLTDTNKVSNEDRVLIYFSGHGHTLPTQRGEMGFIIPEDFSGNNIGAYSNRAFPMEQMRSWSNQIAAKHVLFLVDACYSGLAAQVRAPRETASPLNFYAKNTVKEIITAGNKTDKAVESPEIRHGVFTYMLLRGLEGKADSNQDGSITADELSLYLRQTVPDKAEQYGGQENPKHAYFNSDDEGEFIFELP